jgi:tetratricopeptide (TPR) repeat protein
MREMNWKKNSLGTMIVLSVCFLTLLASGCGGRKSEQFRMEGDTYLGLKKFDLAFASYEKAASANPENALAKVGMAQCLVLQGQPEKAMSYFKEASDINPALEIAYVEAVSALLKIKETDQAIEWAKRLEAINEERGGLLHAYILEREERLEEAIEVLSQLKQKFGQSADVRMYLAAAYLTSGETTQAENELNLILEQLDPGSLKAQMLLIETYRAQGKVSEIIAEYEKLAAAKPNDAAIQLGLARSLLYANRTDEAEVIAREIHERMPQNGWANYLVGAALLMQDKASDAVPYLRIANATLPEEKTVAKAYKAALDGGIQDSADSQPTRKPQRVASSSARPGDWQALWQQASLVQLLEQRQTFLGTGDPKAI